MRVVVLFYEWGMNIDIDSIVIDLFWQFMFEGMDRETTWITWIEHWNMNAEPWEMEKQDMAFRYAMWAIVHCSDIVNGKDCENETFVWWSVSDSILSGMDIVYGERQNKRIQTYSMPVCRRISVSIFQNRWIYKTIHSTAWNSFLINALACAPSTQRSLGKWPSNLQEVIRHICCRHRSNRSMQLPLARTHTTHSSMQSNPRINLLSQQRDDCCCQRPELATSPAQPQAWR